jgi:hypothetical protein
MERQCAWCLRLIESFGDPLSVPQQKRYEVSHGICNICGFLWLEQVLCDTDGQQIKPQKTLIGEPENFEG